MPRVVAIPFQLSLPTEKPDKWIHFLAGRSSALLVLCASSARAQAPQSPPTNLASEVRELQRKLDGRPASIAQQSAPAPQPEPVRVAPSKPAAPKTTLS